MRAESDAAAVARRDAAPQTKERFTAWKAVAAASGSPFSTGFM